MAQTLSRCLKRGAWYHPAMALRSRPALLFIFISIGQGSSFREGVQAQPALDALLDRIPAADTGDSNRYSLTDVQYALGLDLDWNPLLRRAQLRDSAGAPVLTLLAGSEIGHVGGEWLRWSEAPRMNNGQLYVSREILESLFSKFPDLRPQGWEESETPAESIEEFPGEEPSSESGSPAFPGDRQIEIRKLLVLYYPVAEYVVSASSQTRGASEVLTETLNQALTEKGIEVTSLPANAPESAISAVRADALVAFWIESGTPVSPGAFFIYDSPGGSPSPAALTEWGRVDRAQQVASSRLAQKLLDRFLEVFGESRILGLRKGPVASLQGRSVPSVMLFLGVDSSRAEAEIRLLVETLTEVLSAEEMEG